MRARLASVTQVSIQREIDELGDRLNILATIGSVAPFVGLFGTVWGIMRSFTSIAASQNTTLAVVAPGIAEALFATAIGLFAAIPAVIGYNRILHNVGRLEARLIDLCRGIPGPAVAPARRDGAEIGGDGRPPAAAASASRWPRSTSRRWSMSCWCC